jgi:hypothetical protein
MGVKWGSISAMYNCRKACDSVRSKILYNVIIEFGIPMKLVRLMNIYLNVTYGKVQAKKRLIHFIFRTAGSKEMLCYHCYLFVVSIAIAKVQDILE